MSTCILRTCLFYTQYLLTYMLLTADLPTCLPIPWYLPTADLSAYLLIMQYLSTTQPVYQSSYSFVSTDRLSTADLSTYLIISMPSADLSACLVDFSFYSFVSASCRPVYRRPVHLCSLTTADLSTPICPTMSTEYILTTCDFLYAIWSRILMYCASIQGNHLGTTSTNTPSNHRKFVFISVA